MKAIAEEYERATELLDDLSKLSGKRLNFVDRQWLSERGISEDQIDSEIAKIANYRSVLWSEMVVTP